MADSKLVRVRVDGFSKRMPMTLFVRASIGFRSLMRDLKSRALSKMAKRSSEERSLDVKSDRVMKCLHGK